MSFLGGRPIRYFSLSLPRHQPPPRGWTASHCHCREKKRNTCRPGAGRPALSRHRADPRLYRLSRGLRCHREISLGDAALDRDRLDQISGIRADHVSGDVTGFTSIFALNSTRPGFQADARRRAAGSSLFFISGLRFLPIAEASATGFVSPLFVTALSIIFLGEKVGVRRWIATAVG